MSSEQCKIKFFSAFKLRPRTSFLAQVFCLLLTFYYTLLAVSAQSKIAVLVPEKDALTQTFAEKLESSLGKNFKILDASFSESAYRAGMGLRPKAREP